MLASQLGPDDVQLFARQWHIDLLHPLSQFLPSLSGVDLLAVFCLALGQSVLVDERAE